MRKRWENKQTGFTIVELLIVIVVIAILATITVVAYNGIQRKTQVAMAKTDLANIAKQMELYKTQKGSYPTVLQATDWKAIFEAAAGELSDNTKRSYASCSAASGGKYAVVAWAPLQIGSGSVGDELYYVSSESGGVKTLTYQGITHDFVTSSICYLATGSASGAGWSYQLYY